MSVTHRIGTISRICLAMTAVLLPAAFGYAQDAQDAPAYLAYVDGAVALDRESETLDARSGEPLLPGDRFRTGTGLVEILFPDGSAVDLDIQTSVELESLSLIRLTEGRLILVVPRSAASATAASYQIDTPWGSAVTSGPGEYRVSVTTGANDGSVELAVVRGSAQLTSEHESIGVRTGERSYARADAPPSPPEAFSGARSDSFSRWASARRDERLGSITSSRYLPPNLQMYGGTFNRYGAWDYDAANGYIWYPSVDSGWRPYYNGYWSALRPYGWTWIGRDAWGWPTHHYGRWGYARSRWFWIPERRWAPAWVSWATAPDYVSWCPIGLDNRPVFSLSVSAGRDWAGWVVLPRSSFGARNLYVNRYAVEGRRLPRNTPFIARSQAPFPPSFRARASSAASRSDRLAMPRDSRGVVERPRGGPAGGRIAPAPQSGRDNGGATPELRGRTPETRAAVATDRQRAYRRGPESQPRSQSDSADSPRVYGPNPATRGRDTSAASGAVPREPQAATAGRDAAPRRDSTGRPAYSPPVVIPATPPARVPQTSPDVDRYRRNRSASPATGGDNPNRRSAAGGAVQEPRREPPSRAAERPPTARDDARAAPARESATPRSEPRGERAASGERTERSSGGAGAPARARDGGSAGDGRRNR